MSEGPRQAWAWSRLDGSVTQHRVRPCEATGGWTEEHPTGWARWPEFYLCDSPEEAATQARAHFRKIVADAQAVLDRLG